MASEHLTGEQITQLIEAWQAGDSDAFARLFERVYQKLHGLAHLKLEDEFRGSGMKTTALLHELFIILSEKQGVSINNRLHFFRIAGLAMYRFLIDQARTRLSLRGGGEIVHTIFDDNTVRDEFDPHRLLIVHRALEELEDDDPELVKIIKLRFFAGYTIKETAEILEIPVVTVNRRWAFAKIWLQERLDKGADLAD